MDRILMILEVSRKQDYIFASKKLRENAARSEEIAYVTDSAFFRETAGELYSPEKNLVYTGGGHTVLQFDDRETATRFARAVTSEAMTRFDGMELFVKQMPYDAERTPGENLMALTAALEEKKALRKSSFRRLSVGVEALDPVTYQPKLAEKEAAPQRPELLPAPEGWKFPTQFQELTGEDNFIAVVHVDGNAMGKRVQDLYGERTASWDDCRASLQRFSSGIQADFERAFSETVDTLISGSELTPPTLPIRPVILAGDDVCFVTAGKIGLESARVFLEHLTALKNAEDGKPYAACAGVALVHQKFPFHQAYDLAEELCSSAKRFGAELDPAGRVSAMDWHIEFGQPKDSLSQIREDYQTEQIFPSESGDAKAGKRGQMELRPVVVTAPEEVPMEKTGGVRTYRFFRGLCQAMKGEYGNTARSKIKDLRTAFKQGEEETRFFLRDQEVTELLDHAFTARYQTWGEQAEQYRKLLDGQQELAKGPFEKIDGTMRCLFFDAIEMIDHCDFLKEVEA